MGFPMTWRGVATISLACLLAVGLCNTSQASEIPRHLRGDGTVALYNQSRSERAQFKYRNRDGRYNEDAFEEISLFFRCRLTGEDHDIDPKLIEILDAVEDRFKASEVKIISEYRSPERNALMRKKGRRVAKRSLHMEGRAADIEVPGVSKVALRNFAHSLKQGGVGSYSKRGFIHVDTGEVRTWGFAPGRPATRTRPATAHK